MGVNPGTGISRRYDHTSLIVTRLLSDAQGYAHAKERQQCNRGGVRTHGGFDSMSLYGAVKKRLTIHPFSSIAMEAWLVTPVALWYLATIDTSSWAFLEHLTSTGLLLIGAGLTTSVPLILFSYGAKLLPLNVLGFLQYLSPTMGFFLAIFYFGESFGTAQLIAFGCIWVALVLFTLSNQITTRSKLK